MNPYKFLYLIWLLPGYLLFLSVHQALVFYSVVNTYDTGESYVAEVVDYDLKQIAAQTNGYVVLRFETDQESYQQKLSLPVEMAGAIGKSEVIPIRYKKDAFVNIVMMPTYSTQKSLALTNLAMAAVGLLITLFIAFLVHRYTNKKVTGGDEQFVIQRLDSDE